MLSLTISFGSLGSCWEVKFNEKTFLTTQVEETSYAKVCTITSIT